MKNEQLRILLAFLYQRAKFKYLEKDIANKSNQKKSFITLVQLLHVKEENIWIAQLEKPSGSAGFMKPLVDLVNGYPARALDDFHIIALMKRKDPEHLDEEETMKQGERSNWPWLVLICIRETEETTEEFGN